MSDDSRSAIWMTASSAFQAKARLKSYTSVIKDCNNLIELHSTAGSSSNFYQHYLRAFLFLARAHLGLDSAKSAISLLKDTEGTDMYTKEERQQFMDDMNEMLERKAAADRVKEQEERSRKTKAEQEARQKQKENVDPFSVLGISPTASLAEVTTLWKRLSLTYHPEKCGNDTQMKEINNAYDAIKKRLSLTCIE
ncbi:hypothetical protein JCM8547_000527 [Rhodosporidiobolus lusitaniae]